VSDVAALPYVPRLPEIPVIRNAGAAMVAQGAETVGSSGTTISHVLRMLDEQKGDLESVEATSSYNSWVKIKKATLLTDTRTLEDAASDMALGEIKIATLKGGARATKDVGMLTQDASQTVTTIDKNAVNKQVEELAANSVRRGFWTPEHGESVLKKHYEQVDMAWATRRARTDPLGTAEDLQDGLYKGIPQDRAERLSDTLLARAKSLQEEEIRKEKQGQEIFSKWFTEKKREKELELTIAAGAGQLPTGDLNMAAIEWGIHPEQYSKILSISTKEDKASDPATQLRVSIDGNNPRPTIGLNELGTLRESGLLSQKDYEHEAVKRHNLIREDARDERQAAAERRREEADIRRDRNEAARAARMADADSRRIAAEEKSNRHYAYTRAHEVLQASLGIPTQWDKLDQASQRNWAEALRQLNSRIIDGKEDASTVGYELYKRFQPIMDNAALSELQKIDSQMDPRFKTRQGLESNKSRISTTEYNLASDLLTKFEDTKKRVNDAAAAKAAETAKPGGVMEWMKSFLPGSTNQPGAPNRRPQP
jgi:hypothetical protein